MQLVKEIYILTKTFPKEELYSLPPKLKEQPFLYRRILLKAVAGIIRRKPFNFYTSPVGRYMNWIPN